MTLTVTTNNRPSAYIQLYSFIILLGEPSKLIVPCLTAKVNLRLGDIADIKNLAVLDKLFSQFSNALSMSLPAKESTS